MRHLLERWAGKSLRMLMIAVLAAGVAACSGGNDGSLDGGDDIGDGPGGDGGGDGGVPTATISPDGELGTTEAVIVTFSESMDPESLSLGGSMAEMAESEWSGDDDTLTLTPSGQWRTGTQTLELDANDAEGEALETLTAEFNVRLALGDFEEADVVIGQPDFASGEPHQGGTADANTLDSPVGSASFDEESNTLFISDTGSARVLGFQGIPTENNANADMAIGQPDFTTTTADTSATGMRSPYATTTATGQLVVTDSDSHRVLIFDEIPASGPATPSVVLGQESLSARETGCTANNFNLPRAHFVTPDGKLLVADTGNNRVLIWNELPTENAQAPDLVLGQNDFTHCTANDDDQDNTPAPNWPPHAYTLSGPTGIWSDGDRLIVADSDNHRVLIWTEFPTENFAAADQLLGQNSFRTMTPNDADQDGETDGPSANVFSYPNSVWSEGSQIFVSDRDNNRVLVWNGYPEHYFEPADTVIGQNSFTTNAANDADQDGAPDGGPGANTLNQPGGVKVIQGRLFITDTGNSRVLVYGD